MYGNELYATGIILEYGPSAGDKYGWWATVEFQDFGHCDDRSIKGVISTQYGVEISLAIDTILTDVEKLGIKFIKSESITPALLYKDDSENKDYPPPEGWRQLLKAEAARIGFHTYDTWK